MRLEYVTHASLFLQSNDCSMLLDPFYCFDPEFADVLCHFPPREIVPAAFGKLNYVFSSHIHPDHSHPATLTMLKDQIETVVLPADRSDLEKRYRSLGFTNILFLQNGVSQQLQPGLVVTCFWDDPVDTVLVIQMAGKTVLHQNDCRLSDQTIATIAQRFAIDYAFVLYTAPQDIYPLLLPWAQSDLTGIVVDREEAFLQSQIQCLDLLRPKYVIPYSFTLTYFQPDQLHLNGYGRFTPTTFARRVLEQRGDLKFWMMQPGDWIDTSSETLHTAHSKNLWGETLEDYLNNIAEYQKTQPEILPTFDWGDADTLHKSLTLFLTQRVQRFFLKVFATRTIELHILGKTTKHRYWLNLPAKQLVVDREISEQHKPAMIEVFIPAKLAEQLLLKHYDAISILWSYRIKFKINVRSTLSSYREFILYILLILSIFYPELMESGNVDLTQYGLLGQWSTDASPAANQPVMC